MFVLVYKLCFDNIFFLVGKHFYEEKQSNFNYWKFKCPIDMFFFKELVGTSDLPCYHSINFEMKNSLTSMFHSPDSVLLINVDRHHFYWLIIFDLLQVAVTCICIFVILPLTLVGTVLGRNLAGQPYYPCRINAVPRPIPEKKWYWFFLYIQISLLSQLA